MNHAINRVNVISTLSGIIAIGFALIFSNVLSAANRSYTSAEDCNFGVATAQNFEGVTGDTVSIIVPEFLSHTSPSITPVRLTDTRRPTWTLRST
jgi:hypothetical protein